MNKRIIGGLAAGALVATVGFASASALSVDAQNIQYGTATLAGDPDGVIISNWGMETTPAGVKSVKVKDLDNVDGERVWVVIDGVKHGPMTVVGDEDAELKIDFATPLNPADINTVEVFIQGS
jgi:hypothetical protein